MAAFRVELVQEQRNLSGRMDTMADELRELTGRVARIEGLLQPRPWVEALPDRPPVGPTS